MMSDTERGMIAAIISGLGLIGGIYALVYFLT